MQPPLESGVQEDTISNNALISSCEKGGLWEQSLARLRRIRQGHRTAHPLFISVHLVLVPNNSEQASKNHRESKTWPEKIEQTVVVSCWQPSN